MKNSNNNSWISISDLMSALMMIFLFIAISYMQKVETKQKEIKKITDLYQNKQLALSEALYQEFKNDLENWDAEFDKEKLTLRFKSPKTLFEVGKTTVSQHFQTILQEFFPRYIRILIQQKFYSEIQEIRIEGHTDSLWLGSPNYLTSYFNNMNLSQGRTLEVLKYCLLLPNLEKNFKWLQKKIIANGYSSSHPIYTAKKTENLELSRRVEFRIITKKEKSISEIIKVLQ